MNNLKTLQKRLDWEISRYTIDFKGLPMPVIKAILIPIKEKYMELGKNINAAYIQYIYDSIIYGKENKQAKIYLHKSKGINDVMYYAIYDIINGIKAAKVAIQAA